MTVPPKSMAGGVDGVVNGRDAQGGVAEDYNGKQGRAQIQSREILIKHSIGFTFYKQTASGPF